ncbi:MAG: MoxR family ATPase [Desulfurococcales archaeon]|nr:MoxR family ATPase [Desulfurococcales archaeon]
MLEGQVEELVGKVGLLYKELRRPFVGRDEEAKVLILALLTGEHAVLVGEPGTAKSALARRLSTLINARYFKYLLTKYTEPSELFGPLDVRALKEGVYKRITRGKLPEAEIVFLDEIFNANSAILNSLLSIMQERIVYDGYTELKTRIWTIIGASNTIPEEQELQALYDRFLFRHKIEPLPPELWPQLLEASWRIEREGYESARPVVSLGDIREIYENVLFSVDLSKIKEKLLKLLIILEDKGFHVTDRRKGKILKAIAAHALLNGRLTATDEDLIVLKYTIPKSAPDFTKINTVLTEELKTKDRLIRELNLILSNLKGIKETIETANYFDPKLIDYYRSLKSTRSKVQSLVEGVDDEEVIRLASTVMEEIDYLIDKIMSKLNV